MMRKMSAEDVAMVQRGMAERPDSVATLKTIGVPTLILTGEEDLFAGAAEAELMRQNIPGSKVKIIPKAGHYSAWERPKEVGEVLREFFDSVRTVAMQRRSSRPSKCLCHPDRNEAQWRDLLFCGGLKNPRFANPLY